MGKIDARCGREQNRPRDYHSAIAKTAQAPAQTLIAEFRSLFFLIPTSNFLRSTDIGAAPRFFFFTLPSDLINFESWLLLSSVLNTLGVCLNTSSHRILKIRSCASVRI